MVEVFERLEKIICRIGFAHLAGDAIFPVEQSPELGSLAFVVKTGVLSNKT